MGLPRQEYRGGLPFPFSRGSSWPWDRAHVSCIAGRFLTTEPPGKPLSCDLRDPVPRPGVEPGPPALGAQSLSRWTTREFPLDFFCLSAALLVSPLSKSHQAFEVRCDCYLLFQLCLIFQAEGDAVSISALYRPPYYLCRICSPSPTMVT